MTTTPFHLAPVPLATLPVPPKAGDKATWRARRLDRNERDLEETLVMLSAQVRRDYNGPCMFRIEITANVEHGPEGLPKTLGRLTAYRLHELWLDGFGRDDHLESMTCFLQGTTIDTEPVASAFSRVSSLVMSMLAGPLSLHDKINLIYVDEFCVEEGFRDLGIATKMMKELHDQQVGMASLVFFQTMPNADKDQMRPRSPVMIAQWERALASRAKHWTSKADLGFFQPDPDNHPHLIVALWNGEAFDEYDENVLSLHAEKVSPVSAAKT